MNKDVLIGAIAIVVIIGGFSFLGSILPASPAMVSRAEQVVVRTFVQDFGSHFKNVSLLADDAPVQIAREYGAYVSAELLAKWQTKPENAPGRLASSPWPDRADVVAVEPLGDGAYRVVANVVEVTSSGPAGVQPLTLRVEKRDDAWVVTALEKTSYSALPQRVSVVGYRECLPHKDTSGAQTKECMLGLAIDQSDGHLALDLSLMSSYSGALLVGTKLRVEGVLIPVNQLSTNQWDKYDIDGVLSATSIVEVK